MPKLLLLTSLRQVPQLFPPLIAHAYRASDRQGAFRDPSAGSSKRPAAPESTVFWLPKMLNPTFRPGTNAATPTRMFADTTTFPSPKRPWHCSRRPVQK